MPRFTVSSGNIYADLGLPDAEAMLAKSNLVIRLSKSIVSKELSNTEAARVIGIPSKALESMRLGLFDGYTIDQLEQYNARLEAQ